MNPRCTSPVPTLTLGHTLRLARTQAGLPQQVLAQTLGVTPNYLSLVEHDRRTPSLTFLKRYAVQLHLSLGYLLWVALDGEPSP